jgi:hypothetical protein
VDESPWLEDESMYKASCVHLARYGFREGSHFIVLKRPGGSQRYLSVPEELPKQGCFDSVYVLSGPMYKIRIELLSDFACMQRTVMDVGLYTCGGCNLIRKISLPPGAKICPLYNPPHVHAAQGNVDIRERE